MPRLQIFDPLTLGLKFFAFDLTNYLRSGADDSNAKLVAGCLSFKICEPLDFDTKLCDAMHRDGSSEGH
jgi:hypothetical protein